MAFLKSIAEIEEELSVKENSFESKMILWDCNTINDLFDIKWEDSQLFGIMNHLGLFGLAEKGGSFIVAGGAVVRHFMKTDICKGDIDIFPANETTLKLLMKFFQDKGHTLDKHKFSYTFTTKMGVRTVKVQVIHEKPIPAAQRLNQFDFEHCRMGIQSINVASTKTRFITSASAPVALAQRKLHVRYVRDPNYSLIRAIKYKKLGFDADDAIEKLVFLNAAGKKDIDAHNNKETLTVEY